MFYSFFGLQYFFYINIIVSPKIKENSSDDLFFLGITSLPLCYCSNLVEDNIFISKADCVVRFKAVGFLSPLTLPSTKCNEI